MELTVLGRSGRYPEKNGGTSAYLLKNEDTTLLLDMGSGAISRMQNLIGIGDIDGILFSHLHGDHMADFLPFNYMATYLKSEITKPIEIYMPCEPQSIVSIMKNDSVLYHFHNIENGLKTSIGSFDIEFLYTKHPVMSYAMKISDRSGKTFLYTGDTTIFDGIEGLFEGVDVVLGDACVLQKDWTEQSPHIGVSDLARLTKGKRLILTHLPDNEKEIGEILDEATSINKDSEVAIVMKTYKF